MILLPPRCKIQFFEIIIYNFQEKLYIFAGEKISAATEISSSPVVDIIFLLINELQIYRKTKEEAYN
jgi:hypothetical protein|nr:MAG TPA: hypothetical protein [Caudoviricetes sp.]